MYGEERSEVGGVFQRVDQTEEEEEGGRERGVRERGEGERGKREGGGRFS